MQTVKVDQKSLEKYAEEFVAGIKPRNRATVIGLSGDLGAGKTTFAQAVARELGVKESVTSPTFVIEKIYKLENQTFEHLIHIDAYRLESGRELEKIGWREIAADPQNLILIEWPERVAEILPPDTRKITFKFVDEFTRTIEL